MDAQGGLLDAGDPNVVAAPSEPAPKVKVLESGRAKTTVRVTGATKPFWLVLGQSNNLGWRATADGKELGESTLADGYGNGWLVQPTKSGVAFDVSIEWVPQRTVNRAIALSSISVLACLAILGASSLRRRRRRKEGVLVDEIQPAADAELVSPMAAFGRRPGWFGITIATLLALVAASIFVTPWVGVLFAASVLLVFLRPRWRPLLSLLPAFALAGCGAYIAVKQWHVRFPANFEWPTFFWQVRTLGWIAIVFLAGDALIEIVRTRVAYRRGGDAPVTPIDPPPTPPVIDPATGSAQVDPARD
jgi:hypothetical protein